VADAIRSRSVRARCDSWPVRLRVLALLGVAVLFSGCGGSSGPKSNGEESKTPKQALADALAAATAAQTVHVVASGTSDGRPLAFDLHLVTDKGGQGMLTVGKLTFQMIRIGPTGYFKSGPAFWRQFGGAAAAQLLQGRWLKAPATSGDLAAFTPLTDVRKLFKQILGSHGVLKKGQAKTIDGQPAIGVVDTSKDGGGTLWIATTGTPYPLAITEGGGKGSVRFRDWNEPVDLKPPKSSVDFSKLTG
jgi:hypothetical protein